MLARVDSAGSGALRRKAVLLLAMLAAVLVMPGRAQALDDYAYDLLLAHKSDPGAASTANAAHCRNAAVEARLAWLAEDAALAHVAYDSLMTSLRQIESQWEHQLELDRRQGKAGSGFGGDEGSSATTALKQEVDAIAKMIDDAELRRQHDLSEIERLNGKPPCEVPATPPPPPPPLPPPPPFPGPKLGDISLREPHHRQTNCAKCRPLADELNALIDEYADARAAGRRAGIGLLQSEIDTYAQALNACERICAAAGNEKMRHASSHASRRSIAEDNPAIMEGYTPKHESHGTAPSGPAAGPAPSEPYPPPPKEEPEQKHDHKINIPLGEPSDRGHD